MELLKLESVTKYYRVQRGWLTGYELVKAVDGVSFGVQQGESFGIVGESGSGKSTLASLIVMLEPVTGGTIYFDNDSLVELSQERRRQVRRDIQIVFQDTFASLNPRFSIQETLEEPLLNYSLHTACDIRKRLQQVLDYVGLPNCMLSRYPAELSGGERQRICIARALMIQPRFIVFDEATSGLDVILQSQILKILRDLRQEMGLTYLVITHNLKILPYITDRVAVMQKGKIVEIVDSSALSSATHPYTKQLLAALPICHPRQRRIQNPATV